MQVEIFDEGEYQVSSFQNEINEWIKKKREETKIFTICHVTHTAKNNKSQIAIWYEES